MSSMMIGNGLAATNIRLTHKQRADLRAAAEAISETGGNVAGPPGWNPELLPDEGASGSGGRRGISSHCCAATRLQEPRDLLLKAHRMAATQTEFVAFRKTA
jgi:hypothetical protein